MKRRLGALALSMALALSLLQASTLAAEGVGFGYYNVRYSGGSYAVAEDEPLRTSMAGEYTYSLYFKPVLNGSAVAVTSSNSDIFTVEQIEGTEYYRAQFTGIGTAELCCQTDGTSYTLPVIVSLPSSGFSTGLSMTEETFLNGSFSYTGDSRTFYYLCDESTWYIAEGAEVTITSGSEYADWQLVDTGRNIFLNDASTANRYAIQFTIKENVSGNFMFGFECTLTGAGGASRNMSRSLTVQDHSPRLLMRQMSGGNGAWMEDPAQSLREMSDFALSLGNSTCVRLYYGTTESVVPVTDVQVPEGSAVEMEEIEADDGKPCWMIKALSFGTSTLTCTTEDRNVASVVVSVELPQYGLYSAPIRDETHYLTQISYYDLNADRAVWLMSKDGFTQDEANAITATASWSDLNPDVTVAERTSDSGKYDVKLTLKIAAGVSGYTLRIINTTNNRTLVSNSVFAAKGSTALVEGYTIGFATSIGEDILSINDGNGGYGCQTEGELTQTYCLARTLMIAAGVRKTDASGAVYYERADEVELAVQKIWIDRLDGDEVFSFSQSASLVMQENPASGTDVALYVLGGGEGKIRLSAEVAVTIDGKTTTETISAYVYAWKPVAETITRPEDDTVQSLNEYLAQLAERPVEGSAEYTVKLPGITYEGTIIIPEAFNGTSKSLILEGNQQTVVAGGIDLNGARLSVVSDLHFRAGDGNTSALYNGTCLNTFRCTFTGYKIAADSSAGMITITEGNVFFDNETAVRVNLEKAGGNRDPWTNNTFINNGTAIQVENIAGWVSPYYFRISDCNFIGNTTDFNISSAGTFYFYRNYYGTFDGDTPDLAGLSNAVTESEINGLLLYRPAEVTVGEGCKVITNPRWELPVQNWWNFDVPIDSVFGTGESAYSASPMSGEEAYENYLVSDWDQDTWIINGEADELMLAPSAFAAEGEKQIEVVDAGESGETYLGTWTFE